MNNMPPKETGKDTPQFEDKEPILDYPLCSNCKNCIIYKPDSYPLVSGHRHDYYLVRCDMVHEFAKKDFMPAPTKCTAFENN